MSGVNLRNGLRASDLLFDVLEAARAEHPEAFEGLRWPAGAKAFKRDYASALIAFERRRLASPHRADIARTIVEATDRAMVYAADEETPLGAYLETRAEPLAVKTVTFDQLAGLVPEVTFRGEHYQGARLGDLADTWLEKRWMTESAHRGVRWTLDVALRGAGGRADFVGHKCVSLGAGAELSPTRVMLRAGADVLFIDSQPPSEELMNDPRISGTLTYAPGGADLLAQPREIVATIERFAGNDPVHLGMYAYAGGAGKEWRLTAAMNAIARALPDGLVRSVVMLVSPTTPGRVSPEDAAAAEERGKRPWLRPLGAGRSPASFGQSGELPNRVSHSIVGLQGVSYQAAQYIGKMMAAEVYATFGVRGKSGGGDFTVSAPVAPITTTRSLQHPLFEAAFAGADVFDILISEPQATRVMCALLAFHDLLNSQAPCRSDLAPAERVAAIMGEQIHGGVFAQPHALERSISLAAAIGLARRPRLLPPALRFALRGR